MSLSSATLWIVATPLGNPGDLSPRAADVLSTVSLVLAEDTRRSGILFKQCGIQAQKFVSLHEHNEQEWIPKLLTLLHEGKSMALISDAGTPLLSDPGYRLVRACREAGITVSPVPGPSAPLAALCASGLPPQPYAFLGFLPRKQAEQRALLESYAHLTATLILFERKDRLAATLATAHGVLGARALCIARELTKTFEEFIFGRLERHQDIPSDLLGEITVLFGPPEQQARLSPEEALLLLTEKRLASEKARDVIRRMAPLCTGWSSKELYELLQKNKA